MAPIPTISLEQWRALVAVVFLHREKEASDVDVEDPVEMLFGDFAQWGEICDGGVSE